MKSEARWGNKFYETLSKDLKASFPDAKGFSKTNIKNARQFYELIPESEIGRQVVDQLFIIPWGHLTLIISKLIPENFKSSLPTVEEIENELKLK